MEVNEVKKILLMAALATTLLSVCSDNNVKEDVSKNEEEKRESSAKIVEQKEYIVIDKNYNEIFLKDASSNKEESVKVSLSNLINPIKWKAPKRNGSLDIGDHISLEKEEGKYTPTLVKDLVGEIKYDGSIKYKILEATNKSVKWLPLNKENNGGSVPPEMVKVVNASKIKGGDIVTIQDKTKSSKDAIVYELTIVE
ncbi:hypothetical protein BW899_15345 [Bacillus mycoides]|uniref:hypothetical protein n=1 Tax=Bacillus TaxID=1386 RepID=UPI000994195E|nr:hypothetical protein [Bacillus mycoides]OOQ99455.1 hypothetical protein BW899_15345 [Bacillus mycoides]HDR7589294.1 hypothetical protein [Bacillus mycoides]